MFYYLGRKYRLAQYYPQPTHDRIIEPFAGSAAYSLHADNWQREVTLVELDPRTVAAWRYLLRASVSDVQGLPDVRTGERLSDYQLSHEEQCLMGFAINPGASQRSNTVTRFSRWAAQKKYICENIHKVKHWTLIEGDYRTAPDVRATWFIDPPYYRSGKFYMTNTVNYEELRVFVHQRRGQRIVCEQEGATWLPFRELRTERATRGRASVEMVWMSNTRRVLKKRKP